MKWRSRIVYFSVCECAAGLGPSWLLRWVVISSQSRVPTHNFIIPQMFVWTLEASLNVTTVEHNCAWCQGVWNLRSVEVRKSTYGSVNHYIIKTLLIYLKSSGLRTSRMLKEHDNPYTTGTGCWPSVGPTSTEKQHRRAQDRQTVWISPVDARGASVVECPSGKSRLTGHPDRGQKYAHKNAFISSYFLRKSCIWNVLFLLFAHWVAIRSICWETCAHASGFFIIFMNLLVTLAI